MQLEIPFNVVSEMEKLVSVESEWAQVAFDMQVQCDKHSVVDSNNLTVAQKRDFVDSLRKANVALLKAMKHLAHADGIVKLSHIRQP